MEVHPVHPRDICFRTFLPRVSSGLLALGLLFTAAFSSLWPFLTVYSEVALRSSLNFLPSLQLNTRRSNPPAATEWRFLLIFFQISYCNHRLTHRLPPFTDTVTVRFRGRSAQHHFHPCVDLPPPRAVLPDFVNNSISDNFHLFELG